MFPWVKRRAYRARALLREVNNCLFWALWKYYVVEKRRGYLAFRKSTHEHWFVKVHILWHPPEPNDCFVSYAPLKDDLGPFPPPLFKGRVVQGDDEYTGHLRKARGEQQACPVFQQKQKGQQP